MMNRKQAEAELVKAAMSWYRWALKGGWIPNGTCKPASREWRACQRLARLSRTK